MDKETQEILRKGESLVRLVKSQEWEEARTMLDEILKENSSVLTLESKDPQTMFHEVAARQLAAGIIHEWINRVEGGAQAHAYNKKAMEDQAKNDLVRRFD